MYEGAMVHAVVFLSRLHPLLTLPPPSVVTVVYIHTWTRGDKCMWVALRGGLGTVWRRQRQAQINLLGY